MTMMSVLAMLVSLAMMLTGAGNGADLSRTATISNLNLTVNGESVALNPSLSLGARSDGEKGVFDFALNLNGEKLFPVQLAANAEQLTALIVNADTAFAVPEAALNQLLEANMGAIDEDSEDAAILKYLTEELVPAYMDVIEMAKDPELQATMNAKSDALFDEIVDRGEGVPGTVAIDGVDYSINTYEYTLTTDQFVEVAEAVYTSDERLANLYEKLFGFYALLPEESGLNDLHSFRDLFDMTGIEMTADVVEQRSEDGVVDVMDMALTVVVPPQETYTYEFAEDSGESHESVETVELPPMEIDLHSTKVGDVASSVASFAYVVEDVMDMAMDMSAYQDGESSQALMHMAMEAEGTRADVRMDANEDASGESMQLVVNATSDDEDVTIDLNAATENLDEGGQRYEASLNVEASGDNAGIIHFNVAGEKADNGTSASTVTADVDAQGTRVIVSFDVDVTDETIEDLTTGHEAFVIDDLENLDAITEDEAFTGKAAQVMGAMYTDAGKLMADESVQQLMALFTATEERVFPDNVAVDDPELDYEYEGEDDYGYDESYDDDGELPFNEPEFTYLPEGWHVGETNVDTAYDNVEVIIVDGNGEYAMSAYFYGTYDDGGVSYSVAEDGSLVALPDRQVRIVDQGDGMWSVDIADRGVGASLYAYSEELTFEEIGKMVAGLTY